MQLLLLAIFPLVLKVFTHKHSKEACSVIRRKPRFELKAVSRLAWDGFIVTAGLRARRQLATMGEHNGAARVEREFPAEDGIDDGEIR